MTSAKEINLPKKIVEFGAHHPINQTKDFIMSFLESLGFEIVDGPEIETEEFNFDMLNIKNSSS